MIAYKARGEKKMIPTKPFINWMIILTVAIGCPIIIAIYFNAYLIVIAIMIQDITVPVALTCIGWQIRGYLRNLGGHETTGL